jgi:hypothetical protein
MFIRLDLRDLEPVPSLREPDDFLHLEVLLYGPFHLPTAAAALAPVGIFADSDTALLNVEELRRLAGSRGADDAWSSGFAGMLDYARDHGWLHAEGTAVAAHCVWRWCASDADPPLDPDSDLPAA